MGIFLRKNNSSLFDIITILFGGSLLSTFLLKWYFHSSTEKKKSLIINYSPDVIYIQRKKSALLRFLKLQECNDNVETIFYDKEQYNKLVAEKGNALETAWKQRILYESTPLGNVIMYYDAYKKAFSYYADISISYNILNAVAMKYVMMFRCGDFFIDNSITDKESPFTHEHEIDVSVKKDSTTKKDNKFDIHKGPFAKLKKYENKKGLVEGKEKDEETLQGKQKHVVKNKFVYLGKSRDFDFLKRGGSTTKKETTSVRPTLPMTYGDFKKSWHFPSNDAFR